jgi:hypothetical protein
MMSLRHCALALAFAFLAGPAAAQQGTVVHGADSVFTSPTVKLAWAVRRGASEAETLIVVRIIAADASYRFIRVDGVDPFTKDRKVFVVARPLDRETDLAIPRAQFADHPSTEFHFFPRHEDAAANRAALTVFYLGVPDTTPEFPGQAETEAYLDRMLGVKK